MRTVARWLWIVFWLCGICSSVHAAENPWAIMAAGDLRAMHDILEANHPGPVDPQNPKFRVWLNGGLKNALARARTARSIDDYERALLYYKNGFEDDHIGVWFAVQPRTLSWPGFVLSATSAKDVEMIYAAPGAGVAKGARLVSCDGKSIDEILAKRVDPYRANKAVPHDRYYWIDYVFKVDAVDNQPRLKSCTFSSGKIVLRWRDGDYAKVQKIYDSAAGLRTNLSLRKLDGVWLISIPTFDFESKPEVTETKDFVSELKSKAAILQRAKTIVIDVRGNRGGNSGWGDKIAEAIWGKPLAAYVENEMDWTVDWRASPANLAAAKSYLAAADPQERPEVQAFVAAVAQAIEQHRPYVHEPGAPTSQGKKRPPDPLTGKVYFLTDFACASACLDFADIVRRMPNVTHVGLPTDADSVYMDTNSKLLPSRLAHFSYGMKVFRHRVRKNNEWYTPQVRWPGGPMNDDKAIVRWIKSLNEGRDRPRN